MKQKLSLLTTVAIVAAASPAGAQGLLSIGQSMDRDFERKMPFSWTIGAQIGWDSNVGLSENNEQDSAFISALLGMSYSTGDRRTAFSAYAEYSPLWYFDAPRGVDDFQHNIRGGINFRRRINPKLTLTNSFYAAHEVEPNYGIGASAARRTSPYTYGYNSTALAYSWTRRFSTVTSYTITGVDYEDVGNDYLQHIFAQEFRYAMSRTTVAAFTYRYAISDFDNEISDYESHYVLAGLDHQFSPRMSGSFRAGVEFREPDFGDSDESPYVEAALSYRVSRQTDVRWYGVYGFQTNGGFSDDSSIHTGLTGIHRFNTRWTGNLGLHYISEDSGTAFGDFEEDIFAFSAGFEYSLCRNVSLNGGYSFTTSMSDAPYDRHQVRFGVASRF